MKCSELLKLIKKAGWEEVRQSGSHIILRHPDEKDNLIFPNRRKTKKAGRDQVARPIPII